MESLDIADVDTDIQAPPARLSAADPDAGLAVASVLAHEQAACQALHAADWRLSLAETEFTSCCDAASSADGTVAEGRLVLAMQGVEDATRARIFAASYYATCRRSMSALAAQLGCGREFDSAGERQSASLSTGTELMIGPAEESVVAVVLAEAELTIELEAAAMKAADVVRAAVADAAARVAEVAETARLAQEIAVARAAADIAITAGDTAVEVQVRAEEMARWTATLASLRGDVNFVDDSGETSASHTDTDTEIAAAAQAQSDETALAARIVAQAVAASAAVVAAGAAASAAATAIDVLHAAKAVQAVADAAARDTARRLAS